MQQAQDYRARGYRAYKIHPWGDPARDVEAYRALRSELGDDMVLMTDPVAGYTQQQALRIGRELEKLNYYWFEEPLSDYDIYGYQELCRVLEIPIAGVESTPGGLFGTTQYLTQRAVDIVRSDVSWKGGVTGLMKTAALCEAFGVNCEVHTTTNALLDAANLHVKRDPQLRVLRGADSAGAVLFRRAESHHHRRRWLRPRARRTRSRRGHRFRLAGKQPDLPRVMDCRGASRGMGLRGAETTAPAGTAITIAKEL